MIIRAGAANTVIASTPLYYRNSGKVDVSGTIFSLLVSAAVGAALACIYVIAIRSLPSEEFCFFGCAAFGLLLGVLPAALMHQFKVRNSGVTMLVVLVAAGWSYYVSWAVWEGTMVRHHAIRAAWIFFQHPALVYHLALSIDNSGAWSLSSDQRPVRGVALAVVWLMEAVAIFGGTIIGARAVMARAMFCETCRKWVPGAKTIRTSALVDPTALRAKIEAGDYSFVPELQAARGSEFLTFMRQDCDTCDQLNTLSVTARRTSLDRKGRQKSKARRVIDRLLVDPVVYEQFAPPPPVVAAPADGDAPK